MTDEIHTWFPEWDRPRLRRAYRAYMAKNADTLYRRPASGNRRMKRQINFLRHNYTNYDECPSTERKIEVLDLIAVTYPWLAGECWRQRERMLDSREKASKL